MATYSELMTQSQELAAQAEEVRKTEVAGIAAEIHEKMALYKMTAEDLGFIAPKKKREKKVKEGADSEAGADAGAGEAAGTADE